MLQRRILRLLAALGGGLAIWLAFPDHNLWWSAPLGVALFALSTVQARTRTGFWLGVICGLAMFIPTFKWSGTYVGVFPWMALSLLESLYVGILGAILAVTQRRHIAPFLGACGWVATEWLRGTQPFGGMPWARLAFSQADAPYAPIIAWISTPGLTFLLALTGGAIAAAVYAIVPRLSHLVVRRSLFVSAPIAFALLLIGSLITPPTSGKMLRVAAVQGNVPTAGLEFNAQRRAVLDNHVRATLGLADEIKAGRAQKPDVVVWPENSSDIDPEANLDAGNEIMNATAQVNSPLIVGAVLARPMPKVSNASLLYMPGEGVVDTYVKQHPAPFGEYIPYRSFFRMFSKKVDLVRADFIAGPKTGIFTIPTKDDGKVKLAPIICFEVVYDDLMRKAANDGAQIFAVQTNNATFGYSDESTQQVAVSRLRALEYGRSIIHISTVGVSALITPDGVMHDKSSLFTQKVLQGELPLRSHTTLAQRMGRTPEYVSTAILAVALIGIRRRKSSEPQTR